MIRECTLSCRQVCTTAKSISGINKTGLTSHKAIRQKILNRKQTLKSKRHDQEMYNNNTRVYCTAVSSSQSVSILIQYWYCGTKKSSSRVTILHRSATADHSPTANVHVPHKHTQIAQRKRSGHSGSHRSKRSAGTGTARLRCVIKLQQQPCANGPVLTI